MDRRAVGAHERQRDRAARRVGRRGRELDRTAHLGARARLHADGVVRERQPIHADVALGEVGHLLVGREVVADVHPGDRRERVRERAAADGLGPVGRREVDDELVPLARRGDEADIVLPEIPGVREGRGAAEREVHLERVLNVDVVEPQLEPSDPGQLPVPGVFGSGRESRELGGRAGRHDQEPVSRASDSSGPRIRVARATAPSLERSPRPVLHEAGNGIGPQRKRSGKDRHAENHRDVNDRYAKTTLHLH